MTEAIEEVQEKKEFAVLLTGCKVKRVPLCEAAVRKNAEVSCSICYGNPEWFQAVKVGSQLSPGGHILACFTIAQVRRMDIHTYRNISASVIDIYTFT